MSSTLQDLTIRLHQIPAEGLDINLELDSTVMSELLGDDREVAPGGSTKLHARLLLVDDVVHVRGHLEAQLATDCGRCTESITLLVSPKFEFACFPEGSEPAADPDGEVSESDMEITTYRDDQLELGQVIRDEIFLNLPMYPDCSVSVTGRCADYDNKLVNDAAEEGQPGGKLFEALKHIKLHRPD